MAGAALDFGRAWAAREQLRTAVDAASLAGAGQTDRRVTAAVQPGYIQTVCDENSCYETCALRPYLEDRSGYESDIIGKQKWKENKCDKLIGLRERTLVFTGAEQSAARDMLEENWPSMLEPTTTSVTAYSNPDSPHYPSVVVTAGGKFKTDILGAFGIKEISIKRASQSGVFYEEIRDGWNYGRNKAPKPAIN